MPPGSSVVYTVPVAPRFATIFDEPNAPSRYWLLGLGIFGYLALISVLALFTLLIRKAVESGRVPYGSDLICFLLVDVPVFGWCIGGILRLVRDALHY
ncbi:MAG: hypothetical protein ACP5VE_01005 [Chthonomonadales bacterium]